MCIRYIVRVDSFDHFKWYYLFSVVTDVFVKRNDIDFCVQTSSHINLQSYFQKSSLMTTGKHTTDFQGIIVSSSIDKSNVKHFD